LVTRFLGVVAPSGSAVDAAGDPPGLVECHQLRDAEQPLVADVPISDDM
jgi:hypothetical protein